MNTMGSSHAETVSVCVDACQVCHHGCLLAAQHLLETTPGASGSALFAALTHCLGMTRIAAEMVLADSDEHEEACQACAAACRACAELCKAEPSLKECMQTCLDCMRCCEAAAEKIAA